MVEERKKKITLRRRIARYSLTLKYLFLKGKPLVPVRTVYNYLYYAVTGRPRLRYVDLALSYNCNLNCIHCSTTRLKDAGRREMTVEDYRRLGKQLIQNGVLVVQLTGGEPLARPDVEDIIRALNPSRLFISMSTNGLLLTPERLKRLKKAGLDNISISVDDMDPREHDRWRRKEGAQAQALKALDMVLDAGFRGMIFTVVTHQNVRSENLGRLAEYSRKKGVLLLLGWAVPTGNWNANMDVLLTEDDLAYLDKFQEQYLHVRTDFESNYFRWGCGAGKEKLYITPYGDVIACAFVHVRFGNIFQKPLSEIREKALLIDWFKDYKTLCLAANNREFQEKHLSRIFVADKEPISMKEAGFDVEE